MSKKILCFVLSVSLVVGTLTGVLLYKAPVKISADETNGIELSVLKVWDDYNDVEEIRPDSIEVTLYQNNVETNVTATLSASNNWYYKYNVPVAEKDNNGDKINYTWRCDAVDGYERYTDNLDNMYIITDVHHYTGNNINIDSVVLQKFDENDDFFDDCNMRLKDDEGHTLITWTTNDDDSIEVGNSGLDASMDSDGSLVVDGLPAGEYVYEEVAPKTGYTDPGRKEFKIEKGTHNYSYNWYTDIQDAVTDANNLNNNNADCYRDDEDCEVGMFIIGNVAHFILIDDVITGTIRLNVDTVFDLDHKTFAQNRNEKFAYFADLKIIDGDIELDSNRGIVASVSLSEYNQSGNLVINNVDITNETTEVDSVTINHCGGDLYFNNVNITTLCTGTGSTNGGVTSLNFSAIDSSDNAIIENSNFTTTTTYNEADFNVSAINVAATDNLEIRNCNCTATSYSRVSRAINVNNNKYYTCQNVIIDNCVLLSESQNWAFGIDFDNGENVILSNNQITANGGTESVGVDLNSLEHNVDAYNNDVICSCVSPSANGNYSGYRIYDDDDSLHLMSGTVYLQPVRDDDTYTGTGDEIHYDAFGNGINNRRGTLVVDETRGETVISGSYVAVYADVNSVTTLNAGTFKAPNQVLVSYMGESGSLEINGGNYYTNRFEYTTEELNGIWDFAAIYLMGSESDEHRTYNIRNATITGGTYGLVFKYASPSCRLYNCSIKGNGTDIRLDDNEYNRDVYCYIENGTTLFHDGTDQAWLDSPFAHGYGEHVIDNRQQATTSEVTTPEETTQQELTTEGGE